MPAFYHKLRQKATAKSRDLAKNCPPIAPNKAALRKSGNKKAAYLSKDVGSKLKDKRHLSGGKGGKKMKKIRFQLAPTVTIAKSRLQVKRNPAKKPLAFRFWQKWRRGNERQAAPSHILERSKKNDLQSNSHVTKTRLICQAKSQKRRPPYFVSTPLFLLSAEIFSRWSLVARIQHPVSVPCGWINTRGYLSR